MPKTGSTNNLTTETKQIPYRRNLGTFFTGVHVSPDASFAQKFQEAGRIPEVVIALRRKVISAVATMFRARCDGVTVTPHARSTSTHSSRKRVKQSKQEAQLFAGMADRTAHSRRSVQMLWRIHLAMLNTQCLRLRLGVAIS